MKLIIKNLAPIANNMTAIDLSKNFYIFVGQNNSGKTRVLKLLELIFDWDILKNFTASIASKEIYSPTELESFLNLFAKFISKEFLDRENISSIISLSFEVDSTDLVVSSISNDSEILLYNLLYKDCPSKTAANYSKAIISEPQELRKKISELSGRSIASCLTELNKSNFIILENLENSLYPDRLFEAVELLINYLSTPGAKRLGITTHSYLLGSIINFYIYLGVLKEYVLSLETLTYQNNLKGINPELSLNYDRVGCYYFTGNKIINYEVEEYGIYFRNLLEVQEKVERVNKILTDYIYLQNIEKGVQKNIK